MGCINSDGTLTASARKMLGGLREPSSAEALSARTGLPMYRIRSGLRETVQAGLVEQRDAMYVLTDAGRTRMGVEGVRS